MNTVNVDLGQGSYQLRKSAKFIGVQLKNSSSKAKTPRILSGKKLHF